jgi:hypothetical protein
MLLGVATIRLWPLFDISGTDRSNVVYWPEPNLIIDPAQTSGPVVVQRTYHVTPEHEQQFLRAMVDLRRSRLRTGSTQWGLFRDGETAQQFVEIFVVPTWEEHRRQHSDRLTGADQQFQERVDALADAPPQTSHLLSVEDTPASREGARTMPRNSNPAQGA